MEGNYAARRAETKRPKETRIITSQMNVNVFVCGRIVVPRGRERERVKEKAKDRVSGGKGGAYR